jgi:hypothetical protein
VRAARAVVTHLTLAAGLSCWALAAHGQAPEEGETSVADGEPPAEEGEPRAEGDQDGMPGEAHAPYLAEDDPYVVYGEPPPPVYVADLRLPGRLVIGFDFGIGIIDALCTGCSPIGALSLDTFAGLQLSRRVAILGEAWGLFHLLATDGEDTGVATHALATAGSRVWLTPRFWLQGGLGGGMLATWGRGEAVSIYGPSAALAIGREPGHQRCSGIDLSLRIGGTILRDDGGDRTLLYNVAAVVGYHWN